MKKQIVFKFLSIILWAFLGLSVVLVSQAQAQTSSTITVWVHGTNPFPDAVWMHCYSPLRPWLYVQPGLSLASDLPENYYFCILAKTCAQADSVEFQLDNFYTYGWPSSVPSSQTRAFQGRVLFDQLHDVIAQHRLQVDHVKVRLVGFSHGGNLILNTISCLPFACSNVEVEVIFFAIPVQELTRNLINNEHVARAYSFYSDADWMQVMDVQKVTNWDSNVPWLSQKKFAQNDQVIQVKLTIDGVSIGHRDYRSIQHHLPRMLKQLETIVAPDQKNGNFELNFVTK